MVAALVVVGAGGAALARSAALLSYPIGDVWAGAVRFIRVDRGYPIVEKDEGSGYVLFELAEGAKTYKGSLELVRATDDAGRDSTRAVFSVPGLPRHFEAMLLDKLSAKVREERGPPAPPPPRDRPSPPPSSDKPAAPAPPDAGAPSGLPRAPVRKDLPR